jgi:hypothetical protein
MTADLSWTDSNGGLTYITVEITGSPLEEAKRNFDQVITSFKSL